MKRTYLTSGIVALILLPISAHADLLGFNAEDGSSDTATVVATLGSDFAPAITNVIDGALGNAYITTETDTVNNGYPGTVARVASYNVTFPEAGTYDVYARLRIGPLGASDDSFFYGSGFGSKSVTAAGDWITVNTLSVPAGYVWVNLSEYAGSDGEPGVTFTVPSPGTQTFQIGARENGLLIDALAFGTSTQTFTDAELDATVVAPSVTVFSRSPVPDSIIHTNDFPFRLGAVLLDAESSVDTNSIALILDGTNSLALAPADIIKVATTTAVSHAVSSVEIGTHSLSLVYETLPASGPYTNTWSFKVSVPFSSTYDPGSAPAVSETAGSANDFALVENGTAATVVYSTNDAKVVEITAGLFAQDVQRVTGDLPATNTMVSGVLGPVVLIGTLGQSPEIDALVTNGLIDVSAIQGGWEQYHIEVVDNPYPNVPKALVIAGSDRRGTAYGVFSLSEAMGVSPWYFWADSAIPTKTGLFVDSTPFTSTTPSVRYRGIFINDEDWGLQEWSEKNFEAGSGEVKDIGPKTYAKVFELLLRLKANYCWPAMHSSTKAFNYYAGNKVVADNYAIVMGSSHAEPMLRNNVDEWYPFCSANGYSSDWNYANNKTAVYDYWEQRAIANGQYENVYTIGKRGIHDSSMVEGSTTAEKATWLNTIFTDQRQILADHVNPDVTQVRQIFVPYKEVLAIYDSGLVNVPDDVTLVWPDDNHGYIRRLSDPVEQLRSGGGGVYYHLSYWGDPKNPLGEQLDYLWLCSTPPALIWEEMTKAYAYNCKRLWVLNVGDIKPAEIGTEFFLRLAWDVNRYDENAQTVWLTQWVTREFGSTYASQIVSLLNEYYRLGYERKPEHMMWKDWDDMSPSGPYPMFSHVQYGDEAGARLAEYADLVSQANAIYVALPAQCQSAFYEKVLYPLLGADGMNRKFLEAGKAYIAEVQGRNTVATRKAAAQSGYDDIQTETITYNSIDGGKWNEMMDAKPRGLSVFNMTSLPSTPSLSSGTLGVAVEGQLAPAYISSSGVTSPDDAEIILLNAATDYTALYSPMIVTNISGKLATFTPGSVTGAQGPGTVYGAATYDFSVSNSGTYALSCEINCPAADDDSWFIKMDGGSATTWNNLDTGGIWGWATYGSYSLSAGSHTLTVYRREDGAAMANIKLRETTSSVLMEDQSMAGFELPEFNTCTRRSYFVDLFNTGTGSVNWQITPSNSWVKVSATSGSVSSEQRVWVSIDWPSAPQGEFVTSFLAVESAGQTLRIPVTVWNPSASLPLSVDFVEDNGVVAIEAERVSCMIPAADASWSRLYNLGQGGGSMMVSPATAASRESMADITNTSPALVYNTYLRTNGVVNVTARFIPTLAVSGTLRYAVSFDDQVPQIIDMARTSGSGSAWNRSVLRAYIDYTTSHTLTAAGEHQLKIWMVDSGVVLDRLKISTKSGPYTYRGAPETAVSSFGSYTIGNEQTLILNTNDWFRFDSITNNGTLTLLGSASLNLDGGPFVNNGVLDIITWQGTLPAGFLNNGMVLTRTNIEIRQVEKIGPDLRMQIQGYANHGYQLQQASGGDLTGLWNSVGASVLGTNNPITFVISNAFQDAQGFYRVLVTP